MSETTCPTMVGHTSSGYGLGYNFCNKHNNVIHGVGRAIAPKNRGTMVK